MSDREEHSSFIKTPQQLVVVILLAFVVPVVAIVLLVQVVVNRPHSDPAKAKPETVEARIQPVGRIEVGAETVAAGQPRAAADIVKQYCAACHASGAAGAPKIGDKAAWGKIARPGLAAMLKNAIQGKGSMPPRGGASDLSDFELARAIVDMANQSGANLKEPAGPGN